MIKIIQLTASFPIEKKEISEIYVSEYNGYFISNDLQNALKLTQDFFAKKYNARMTVSFVS